MGYGGRRGGNCGPPRHPGYGHGGGFGGHPVSNQLIQLTTHSLNHQVYQAETNLVVTVFLLL